MGKKKGGKKSGGKKRKGGKKKKDDQMTWKEALLAYQINIKEKQMEDVRYEVRALEEKRERHLERNQRLKEEQVHYMKLLLKQARNFESKLSQEKEVDKKEVIEVMMDKWDAGRQEEKNIADLKEQIARTQSEIVREQRQASYWTEYKDRGQHDHKKQIMLLEHELVDMQRSFDEMAGHLSRTLNQAKDEIGKVTDDKLDKQKYLATEKAIAKMDKYSRQEVQDNEWLIREVELHKHEVEEMIKDVETSEQENLGIMSELFECTVDDLKISRNFYLTQFADSENIDETGILEVDLSKISIHDRKEGTAAVKPQERPLSGKLHSIVLGTNNLSQTKALEEAAEEDEGSLFDGENGVEDEEDDPFNNYYNFDDEDFDDYLQLGPLQLKLLNIRGKQMPIYKPQTPPPDEMKAKDYKPDEWPVTGPMIKKTVYGADGRTTALSSMA